MPTCLAPSSVQVKSQFRLLCMAIYSRRVWLFANNPLGARASANLFTLVSSARANGLEPYAYLNYVFENLPAADTVEALERLLPWSARAVLAPSFLS